MNDIDIGRPDECRSLDIRLLGFVRVQSDAHAQLDIGGPKPRAVLVRLALRAGEVVSTDNLIDTLWGDDPPLTARRSVQAHVAKLRASLGGDDGPLRSSGNGYVLDVPRDAVDVLRIEDNLESAREALATDPAHAAELVESARLDWTGTPFDDLTDHADLAAERERLRRLRDDLDELDAELDMSVGNAVASIGRFERAVADDPSHEPHWMRLIRAYYASGRQRDALEGCERAARALLEHLGVDPSPQLRQLELQILHQDVPATEADTCPYKGLVSYQISDGATFFGRSDVTDELVQLVLTAPVGIVVGPSGVGKSSVVRAGLGYRIASGQVSGLRTVTITSPGLQPLRSLFSADPADVLVVDQFEELFTLTDDPGRREEFVHELLRLPTVGSTRVLIVVRADFYDRCMTFTALSPVLARHQVNIGPMTAEGHREAIVGPARRAGLTVEPELLDVLIDEVSERPGALPLLSHALTETWRRRTGTGLTVDAYRRAGSIAGSISLTAERLYEALDVDDRAQLERLFVRLVEPGSGTAHTRRMATADELEAAGFDAALVDRMVSVRLLTVTIDGLEIAHESLISAWPRLMDWIDGRRDDIAAQQRLTRDSSAWQASGRDDADLYRGSKLSAALAWQAASAPSLSPIESEFLRVSDEHAQGELARQRRVNRRLRVLAATSIVAMVAALSATFVAVGRSREADRRRNQVEVNQLATVFSADASLLPADRLRIGAALQRRSPTVDTADFLVESLLAIPDVLERSSVEVFALTGDAPTYASGMAIAALDMNGRPTFIDGTTLVRERRFLGSSLEAVVMRPEGVLAVSGTTYEVIDLDRGRSIGPGVVVEGEPVSAALSLDGAMMAIASIVEQSGQPRARITLVDVPSGSTIGLINPASEDVRDLEFTGDSSGLMAVVDSVAVAAWDVPTGRSLVHTNANAQTAAITTSAFNRGGDGFAIGRADGTVEMWSRQVSSWASSSVVRRHADAVTWVEFDSSDTQVVSSGRDGSVALSDPSDGSLIAGPTQFDATGSLASFFDPGTGHMVTIDSDGTTWRWSTSANGLTTLVDASSSAPPATDASEWFGTSGREAISVTGAEPTNLGFGSGLVDIVAGWSGNLVLVFDDRLEWRRRDGELVRTIDIEESSLGGRFAVTDRAMAYLVSTPDENERRRIVVVAADGTTIDTIELNELRGDVQRLDISPAGDDLVYSTAAGELLWYSLDSLDAALLLDDGRDGHFVDDGLVVAVGEDGVRLVDLDDPSSSTDVGIGRGAVRVAFHADQALAATSDRRGQVALWDLESRRQLGPRFSPLGGEPPGWIGITRNGHLVADASNGSMIVSLADADWISKACALAAALDPDGELPPDPRLSGDEPCA